MRNGIGADIISMREEITEYKLVIAPHLFLISDELADRLKEYVKQGGTLVITNRSGVKNENNVCLMEPLPGKLTDLCQLSVEEYNPIGLDEHSISDLCGKKYKCSQWCDILKLQNAEPYLY